DSVADEIAPGEHAEHAGERQRGLRIDGRHIRVGVRRADEDPVPLPRRVPVLGVAAPAGQQAEIFAALDQRADPVDPPWLRHTGRILYRTTAPDSGTWLTDDQTEETSMSYEVKVEDIEYLRHGN